MSTPHTMRRVLASLGVTATLAACGAHTATAPKPAPLSAASARPALTDGPTAIPSLAVRHLGERPEAPCTATHPLAPLPLSAVHVETWAAALAAYTPRANGGRPVQWDAARPDVEHYLSRVHDCVHTIFADSFLHSLIDLPATHPLSDPELATTVELVIDGESGRLEAIGVVASSGAAEFDAAAVTAFETAFPLPPPPASSLSSDGHLYVTWELHRSIDQACRASAARAWKLRF